MTNTCFFKKKKKRKKKKESYEKIQVDPTQPNCFAMSKFGQLGFLDLISMCVCT